MNLFAASPEWLVWLLATLLAAATIQDAVQLKISNLITVAVFALALVAAALTGFDLALWQNVLVFTVVFAVGMMLFTSAFLGGGDVKLLAAVALWADGATALKLIVAIALCGGVLALAILFLRVAAPKAVAGRVRTLKAGAGIPYGIAIAAGTLITIWVARLAA